MSPLRQKIWFWFRLVVPILLLGFIFSRINLAQLLYCLKGVRIELALCSLLIGYFLPIFLCVWRWQLVLRVLYKKKVPYLFLLKQFWTGMFIGYMVPGGIGTDIYRVSSLISRFGGIKLNTTAVIGEKAFVLLANGILVIISYPMIAWMMNIDFQINRKMHLVYGFGLVALVGLFLLATWGMFLWPRWRSEIPNILRFPFRAITERMEELSDFKAGAGDLWELIKPFFLIRNQWMIIVITLISQGIACYGGRLMLLSIGVDLPLMVHIFIWNLMVFIFLVPISIGTLGVREGAFIILFGLFGVGRETALTASFIGLASLLVTVSLGSLFWFWDGLSPVVNIRSNKNPI